MLPTADFTRSETPANWNHQASYPSRSACAANEGYTFEVGPGKAFSEPRNVPWLKLGPCDTVLIHYRSTPYSDIVFIGSRGAANKYITVRGVPDPSTGARPVFDGANAVMPSGTGANTYTQSTGMFIVAKPSVSNRAYMYKPGYIHFSGLHVRNVRTPYQVTDMYGSKHAWADFVAAFYISPAEHVAITDCEIADSSLGLFVNSQDNEASQSRNILVRNNYFHGNGMVNQASMHNAYTEAIGTIYEYNYFGAPVSGTGGDNIKERSAGVIFRYNYIEDGVNLISLRDPQSNADFEAAAVDSLGARLASQVYIYGNIFAAKNPTVYSDAPVIIGHGDGIYGDGKQVRDGAIHFYGNRVVSTLNYAAYQLSSVPLFDLINTRSATTVYARNNLFYATSRPTGGTPAQFALFYWQGLADWQGNWINTFKNVRSSSGDNGLSAGTMFNGSGLGGLTATPSVDPAFVSFSSGNYLTTSSSPFASLAAPLPSAVTARGLSINGSPVTSPFSGPALP